MRTSTDKNFYLILHPVYAIPGYKVFFPLNKKIPQAFVLPAGSPIK
jgi:hypothetical protein